MNPYDEGTPEHEAWQRGMSDGYGGGHGGDPYPPANEDLVNAYYEGFAEGGHNI